MLDLSKTLPRWQRLIAQHSASPTEAVKAVLQDEIGRTLTDGAIACRIGCPVNQVRRIREELEAAK